MIFIIIYIYSYLYLCIYTPSYPHFKAFPVSKFNSETSFLYQLFKENSTFIVSKPSKLINEAIFWFSLLFIFVHIFIYAFLVSKFNSETSFLYQLFKENSNFIVTEPCKVISKYIFYNFQNYLYLFVSLFMHLYTFI